MKVTVFTPTYNRAYIIERLYRSLQYQSCMDFEWLVVDDGSTDNTQSLFARWQKEEKNFPIRYVKQKNGGKHRAINHGLDLAEGELFFSVDSDDYLTEDAVEKIIKWEAALPHGKKYCGVAGNLGTAPDQTPNHIFQEPFIDGSALQRYGIIDGERAMVFYTAVHRKYKYPTFAGENFMTEAVAWNRMAGDGYKIRFFNDIIWIYEYRDDGLTMKGSRLFLENPKGYGLWLKEKAVFSGEPFIKRVKLYYTFTCDLFCRLSSRDIAECIDAPVLLVSLFYNLRKLVMLFRK